MLINWFTVIAQVVNFLILVVLLKFLLYDRIIRAMDEREERIRSRLEDAQKERNDAKQEVEAFRTKNREFEEQREKMHFQAKQESEVRRKELVQLARIEVENLKKRWHGAVQREKESFIQDLRQMTSQEVYAVARRAFEDLANANVEEHAVEVFISHIRNLNKAEAREIANLIREDRNRVVMRSAFEIPSGMRQKISKTLNERISKEIHVVYETSPELLMGLELKTQSRKISWNLDHYLETLEERAREMLQGLGPREEGAVRNQDEEVMVEEKTETKEKPGG